jgi:hypothetical protein
MPKLSRSKIRPAPKTVSNVIASNGMVLEKLYCRKCCEMKKPGDFFNAVDLYLDSSGKMSVCKKCCHEMYEKIYVAERALPKTIYRMCKILNVRYDERAISSLEKHMRTAIEDNKNVPNVFGTYKMKLATMNSKNVDDHIIVEDLTFIEPDGGVITNPLPEDHVDAVDLKQFWGTNLEYDDYVFLERELTEWKKTHKSDTKAEEFLLKELCHKSLEIRKAREIGKPTSNIVKELQELMKTANVDPAKTSIAGAGKAKDTFSSYIEVIEYNEPADYFSDKQLFKDFDNIDFYFKKYLLRPLKNFLTQSRDFNVEFDNGDDDDIVDIEEIIQAVEGKEE